MGKKSKPKVHEDVDFCLQPLPDDEPQRASNIGMTPSIFDLEEALELLEESNRWMVMLTRIQLAWLMRACNTTLDVKFRHPYKGSS